eukprot:5295398-Amphidinium_carterae.1
MALALSGRASARRRALQEMFGGGPCQTPRLSRARSCDITTQHQSAPTCHCKSTVRDGSRQTRPRNQKNITQLCQD